LKDNLIGPAMSVLERGQLDIMGQNSSLYVSYKLYLFIVIVIIVSLSRKDSTHANCQP